MGFKFNPLAFSGFDLTSAGGPGYVLPPVPDEASLPASATDGFHIVVLSTDHIYVFDGTTSKWVDTGLTAASFGITPNANGYSLITDTSGSIVRNKLVLQPADATNPGGVSTATQSFSGDKTFVNDVVVSGDLTVNGTLTYINTTDLEVKDKNITLNKGGLAGLTGNAGLTIEGNGVPVGYAQVSADTNKWELKAPGQTGIATINPGAAGITLDQSSHDPVTLAAVGSSPNANAASLNNQELKLQPADATNPGVVTAGTQTFGGAKTFNTAITGDVNYTPADSTDWLTPVPTLVAGALDALADKIVAYDTLAKEPTGFPNLTDSSTSFVDGTRTFTIQPTGASFDFYVKGKKFTKSAPESVTLSNNSGNHYIYYDSNGLLSSTIVFSSTLITDNAIVSDVYWNTDTNTHTYFAEERHGLVMDGATHSYLHTVFGARYLSGLALQGFSVDGDGSSNAHAQFTSDSGSIRDEDLLIQILAESQIPILYRQGQLWRKKAANAFPLIYSGTAGYTGASGRIPYNQYTGGAWQLTEVVNNGFVLVHFFATNDKENGVVGIQGTATYNNVTAARIAANSEITALSGLPFAEFVPIGSVVFETANAFSNTPKAIVRSTNGGNYVDFRGTQLYTPAGTATTHGLLSGLANDDHLQYLLVDGTRAMQGDISFQNQYGIKLGEASPTANYIKIQSPASLVADYTLTLPSDDGINQQYLKTDGSGNLTWEFPKHNGKLYHVSADGRSEYTSIQTAINAAQAASPSFTNPQFIIVHGSFTEDLTISKTGIFLIGETSQKSYFNQINGSLTINKAAVIPGENATNSLVYVGGLYFTKAADNSITITGSNPQRVFFENCSFAQSSNSIVLIDNSGTNSKTSFKDCIIQIDSSAVKVPVTVNAGWADFDNCYVSNTSSGGTALNAADSALVTIKFSQFDGILNFTANSQGVISVTSITTTSGAALNITSSNILGVAASNLGITVPAATSGVVGTGYFYHTNVIYGGLGSGFASTVNASGLNIEMGNIRLPNRGSITFAEALANGQNVTTIKAAASIGTDFTLTLPNAVAASSNSALVSDTSGNLSYAVVRAASAGDLAETSFTAANNQSSAANVTGFSFANATVRGFNAQVTITRGSTYADYNINGIQKAASWELVQDYVGDDTGIVFTITSAGQVQYTSTNTGSTATIKFRAQTLSV